MVALKNHISPINIPFDTSNTGIERERMMMMIKRKAQMSLPCYLIR